MQDAPLSFVLTLTNAIAETTITPKRATSVRRSTGLHFQWNGA
jgi:hypothetical protein